MNVTRISVVRPAFVLLAEAVVGLKHPARVRAT